MEITLHRPTEQPVEILVTRVKNFELEFGDTNKCHIRRTNGRIDTFEATGLTVIKAEHTSES